MTDEERKARARESSRRWKAANREKYNARAREYQRKLKIACPEKIKAKEQEYCRKRAEKMAANPKEMWAKKREYQRQWIALNHEKYLAQTREYYRKRIANKEIAQKLSEYRSRRWAVQCFADVEVEVEVKKLLVETKLLQLNVKKLLRHGEANEKRS